MTISGYALITERTAIEVDPINVMVNGEVFQPRNAQGELVDVFAYNGTTYAPLRALAEAYGLEVGYDAEKNLATVSKPGAASNPAPDEGASAVPNFDDWSEEEEAAYQEFKEFWRITIQDSKNYGSFINLHCYDTEYAVDEFLLSHTVETIEKLCARFDVELYEEYKRPQIMYHFTVKGAWGWQDVLSESGWVYGYRRYLSSLEPF